MEYQKTGNEREYLKAVTNVKLKIFLGLLRTLFLHYGFTLQHGIIDFFYDSSFLSLLQGNSDLLWLQ